MILRNIEISHRGVDHDTIFMNGPNSTTQTGGSHVDPLDDVFGSAPNSPILRPANTAADDSSNENDTRQMRAEFSDVPRLRTTHVTNGYREGIAASKEQHIQAGFDEGYSLGAQLGLKTARVLGRLEGLLFAVGAGEQVQSKASVQEKGESEIMAKLLAEGEKELSVQSLFGKEHFGEDGIWIYDVPGQEDESETTFLMVAAAHPVVRKWEAVVKEKAEELGLFLR